MWVRGVNLYVLHTSLTDFHRLLSYGRTKQSLRILKKYKKIKINFCLNPQGLPRTSVRSKNSENL